MANRPLRSKPTEAESANMARAFVIMFFLGLIAGLLHYFGIVDLSILIQVFQPFVDAIPVP